MKKIYANAAFLFKDSQYQQLKFRRRVSYTCIPKGQKPTSLCELNSVLPNPHLAA